MNKELLNYIQGLSIKDKKTLSQKALKVSEETGELAKVVLPFDNAHGTTHRFIEKGRILEESVDVILTAISIAYELGYSHEDIEEAMQTKAEKWHSIQAKEEKIEYPLPYEIHITVNLEDYINLLEDREKEYVSGKNIKSGHSIFSGPYVALDRNELEKEAITHFKTICNKTGVKPIVLDLENNSEIVMKDVMTSSHHFGNNTSSYYECLRIAYELEEKGFTVVRKKVETVPWHPAAPSKSGDKMPEDCYFEAHIGCVITKKQKSLLKELSKSFGAHLSRNYFKKLDDGKFVNMITLRRYDGLYESFEIGVNSLQNALEKNNIKFEKVIIEFAIYDTKVSHDFKWLENKL